MMWLSFILQLLVKPLSAARQFLSDNISIYGQLRAGSSPTDQNTYPTDQGNSDGRINLKPGTTPESTDSDVGDIEEGRSAYVPGRFHPVYIGDVYHHGRYQVVNKLGYGSYSTVWLVKDLKSRPELPTPYRAMKVLSAECYGQGHDTFEREILQHLRGASPNIDGFKNICHLLDDFEHVGPNGTHVCLISFAMGETLATFGSHFRDNEIPNSLMQVFTIQLLLAFDFIHGLGVIHTDIKPDNIFVKFRDYSLIESGYLVEVPVPHQDRQGPYIPIPSHSLRCDYFNRAQWEDDIHGFQLALGDFGVSSWVDQHLCELIQPVALRSPEVLIGAGWDEYTDFWNLGAVILEVFRAIRMFDGSGPPDGRYLVRQHIREIVDLFGPFPKELLERGDQKIVEKIFNDDGTVKDAEPLVRAGLDSEVWMSDLEPETRKDFVSFLGALMRINPDERPRGSHLLSHPWLLEALPFFDEDG